MFYWIHANIDGRARWHLVYDKDPGLLFVASDFEEDEYDIKEYKKDFPLNKVVGLIEPPLPCTCDENCDDPSGYEAMLLFYWCGTYWKVSLYSDREDVDVSKVAKAFGGGGHKGAAGFQVKSLLEIGFDEFRGK